MLRALDAGKHALVELPLAGNLADAQRVVQAAERSDQQVFVDMFERFIPANRPWSTPSAPAPTGGSSS